MSLSLYLFLFVVSLHREAVSSDFRVFSCGALSEGVSMQAFLVHFFVDCLGGMSLIVPVVSLSGLCLVVTLLIFLRKMGSFVLFLATVVRFLPFLFGVFLAVVVFALSSEGVLTILKPLSSVYSLDVTMVDI